MKRKAARSITGLLCSTLFFEHGGKQCFCHGRSRARNADTDGTNMAKYVMNIKVLHRIYILFSNPYMVSRFATREQSQIHNKQCAMEKLQKEQEAK